MIQEGRQGSKQGRAHRPTPRFADFPYSEWKARIERAKTLMREQGIDLLMLWNDRNIRYFAAYTSTHWEQPSIPPLLVVIPVDADPVAMTGEFFLSTAEMQTWIRDIRVIGEGYAYSEKTPREISVEVAAVVRDIGYGKANIALEMGGCYKGYWADMGRVINVGPITEDFQKYSEQLIRAFELVVQAVKPGMTVGELQQAIFTSGGMDTPGETMGHGIGLDIHEPPFISRDSDMVLEPGMTLEVEPYLFRGSRKQGGLGYFHYENLIVITERGCTPIYSLPAEILQVAQPFN